MKKLLFSAASLVLMLVAVFIFSPSVKANILPPVDEEGIPPVVTITSPVEGAVVTRRSVVTIEATATDDEGVTQVYYKVNGDTLCTGDASLTSCDWEVPSKRGTYDIVVGAYDASSNLTLDLITVTVK